MQKEVHKLHPILRRIFHLFSYASSFMITVGFFWAIQIYTFGLIPMIRKATLLGVPIFFVLSFIIAVFLVKKFIKIKSPYY
ncbi:hypothetical protein [Paenibacillus polymyxa]|uniref:hypothetical protein n=1 Tax=Paenibacillus polymyxa TaxID=1406 RepID=UPI00077C526A|nr:hypothetical protein [Paenibacillus polymyxa]KYG95671.1 hypothetical protein AZE31_17990 [Paenibacillus polymyxa]